MPIYVGQFKWVTDNAGFLWQMPRADIGLGCLDLCSLPQGGQVGGTGGFGVFVTSQQDNSIGYYLGDTLNRVLTNSQKTGIKNRLSLPSNLNSSTLVDVLWELFNRFGDPTGQARWKPLMPGIDGKLKLYLGGFSLIKSEGFDPLEHTLVIPAIQEDYRRIRQECLVKGSDHYKKYLDALEAKYKLPYQTFIPPDLPDEGKLPRSTTITDNFNRVNAEALGTSAEGWSWTELIDTDIVSNVASAGAAGIAGARAESALSTDDHYVQVKGAVYISPNSIVGGAIRYLATGNTYYCGGFRNLIAGAHEIFKCITGTRTQLWTANADPPPSLSTWYTTKVQVDGSSLEYFFEGVSKITGTNTAITGNLYSGIGGVANDATRARWDDFTGADLAAGGWANIAKVNGVAAASMSKMNGIAVTSISKVSGVAV